MTKACKVKVAIKATLVQLESWASRVRQEEQVPRDRLGKLEKMDIL